MNHFPAIRSTLIWGVCLLIAAAIHGAEPYKQPLDGDIRTIIPERAIDGDTCVVSVILGKLGGTVYRVNGVRLRLKDVNAFEMNATSPADRETAVMERNVLAGLLATPGPITARLYRQTYNRYEAILYTRRGCVNDQLRKLPQNK